MSSKREMTACAERLLSLLEVPDGVELEETVDMVLIDLQMHIVDSGTRSAVASVLADRVFALLMQTFIAHYPEIDHEYVTIFYAYNHVFETEMYDTADLPRISSIGGKLKRMQEEFALPRNYEEWVLYFLNQDRMARILELTQTAFGEFAVCLHGDGKLDLAVHSGHHFFEVGRDRNNTEALKQRYTRELKWCRDMLDVFISTDGIQ